MKRCLLVFTLLEERHPRKMVAPACEVLRDFALQDPAIAAQWSMEVDRVSQSEGDEDVLLRFVRLKPDLIGFSCYVWNMTRILTLCRKIKMAMPRTRIVLGGPETADYRRTLQKAEEVDFIVPGEGEIPFAGLLRALGNGRRSLHEVPSLKYRVNGAIVGNADGAALLDLKSTPLFYTRERARSYTLETVFETSRGCPYRCHFCNWGQIGEKVRFHPLSRVIEELGHLLSNPEIRRIQFIDSWLDADPGRLKAILRHIAQENRHGISFAAYLSFRKTDAETVSLLTTAGFTDLGIGLQSTEPATLKAIKRPWAVQPLEDGVLDRVAAAIGPDRFIAELIYGLPGDTYASFRESLRWCLARGFVRLRCFRALALPGSHFYDHPEPYGLVFDREPLHLVYGCKTFPYDDIIRSEWLYEAIQVLLHESSAAELKALLDSGVDLVGVAEELVSQRLSDPHAEPMGRHPTEMYSYLLEVQPEQSRWVFEYLRKRRSRAHRILSDYFASRREGGGARHVQP